MFQKDRKEAGYISESCEIAKAFEMVKGRSIKDRDGDFDENFDFSEVDEGINKKHDFSKFDDDLEIIDAKYYIEKPCKTDTRVISNSKDKLEIPGVSIGRRRSKSVKRKPTKAQNFVATRKHKSDSSLTSTAENRRRDRTKGKQLESVMESETESHQLAQQLEKCANSPPTKKKKQRRKSKKERTKSYISNKTLSTTNLTTLSQTRTTEKAGFTTDTTTDGRYGTEHDVGTSIMTSENYMTGLTTDTTETTYDSRLAASNTHTETCTDTMTTETYTQTDTETDTATQTEPEYTDATTDTECLTESYRYNPGNGFESNNSSQFVTQYTSPSNKPTTGESHTVTEQSYTDDTSYRTPPSERTYTKEYSSLTRSSRQSDQTECTEITQTASQDSTVLKKYSTNEDDTEVSIRVSDESHRYTDENSMYSGTARTHVTNERSGYDSQTFTEQQSGHRTYSEHTKSYRDSQQYTDQYTRSKSNDLTPSMEKSYDGPSRRYSSEMEPSQMSYRTESENVKYSDDPSKYTDTQRTEESYRSDDQGTDRTAEYSNNRTYQSDAQHTGEYSNYRSGHSDDQITDRTITHRTEESYRSDDQGTDRTMEYSNSRSYRSDDQHTDRTVEYSKSYRSSNPQSKSYRSNQPSQSYQSSHRHSNGTYRGGATESDRSKDSKTTDQTQSYQSSHRKSNGTYRGGTTESDIRSSGKTKSYQSKRSYTDSNRSGNKYSDQQQYLSPSYRSDRTRSHSDRSSRSARTETNRTLSDSQCSEQYSNRTKTYSKTQSSKRPSYNQSEYRTPESYQSKQPYSGTEDSRLESIPTIKYSDYSDDVIRTPSNRISDRDLSDPISKPFSEDESKDKPASICPRSTSFHDTRSKFSPNAQPRASMPSQDLSRTVSHGGQRYRSGVYPASVPKKSSKHVSQTFRDELEEMLSDNPSRYSSVAATPKRHATNMSSVKPASHITGIPPDTKKSSTTSAYKRRRVPRSPPDSKLSYAELRDKFKQNGPLAPRKTSIGGRTPAGSRVGLYMNKPGAIKSKSSHDSRTTAGIPSIPVQSNSFHQGQTKSYIFSSFDQNTSVFTSNEKIVSGNSDTDRLSTLNSQNNVDSSPYSSSMKTSSMSNQNNNSSYSTSDNRATRRRTTTGSKRSSMVDT